MQIRRATIEDAPAISAVIVPLVRRFILRDCTPEGADTLLRYVGPEEIAIRLREDTRYFVAEENGAVVGIVGMRDNRHLYHLFVAESHQRQGLARELWTTARDACIAAGNPGEFTVNSSLYAAETYRCLGFADAGPPQELNGVVTVPLRFGVRSEAD